LANIFRKPAAAHPDASICRKIKLKNFYEAKPAGGCGVAPFLSVRRLFCRAEAAPAQRCERDPIEGNTSNGCAGAAL